MFPNSRIIKIDTVIVTNYAVKINGFSAGDSGLIREVIIVGNFFSFRILLIKVYSHGRFRSNKHAAVWAHEDAKNMHFTHVPHTGVLIPMLVIHFSCNIPDSTSFTPTLDMLWFLQGVLL